MTHTARCEPTRNRAHLVGAMHLFLPRNGKILLQRRANTGYLDGHYTVPGGHIEPGESAVYALAREAEEEIGIQVVPAALTMAHVMHRRSTLTDCGNSERVDFFFTAEWWDGDITNREPHKCDEVGWYPVTDLPQATIPYVRAAINYHRDGRPYSQQGWNQPCPRCGNTGLIEPYNTTVVIP